ncbi:uncharacterized protein LOC120348646 isoform X2 [Styela clava]
MAHQKTKDTMPSDVPKMPSNMHWEIMTSNNDGVIITPHGLVNGSHCAAIMMSLYLLHQQDLHCDFSIIILPSSHNGLKDPVTYTVHKLIFSTLSTRIQELTKPMIKIGGKVTCQGIESVIEYVYTGRITDIQILPIELAIQINRAALALGIQLKSYLHKQRNDMVETSTKVYVGQLHESGKDTVIEKAKLTVSMVSDSGKLLPMDECDADTVVLPEGDAKRKKSFSKQAVEMRRKRLRETPQQKSIRREKDRLRKQEFRKRQRELPDISS